MAYLILIPNRLRSL